VEDTGVKHAAYHPVHTVKEQYGKEIQTGFKLDADLCGKIPFPKG
jgi:hypothetical protein